MSLGGENIHDLELAIGDEVVSGVTLRSQKITDGMPGRVVALDFNDPD